MEDPVPMPPTTQKNDLLTSKTWKMSALTINPGYDTSIAGFPVTIYDAFNIIPPCKKDDTYKFNKDSSFVESEEANVCSPSASGTGVWFFNPSKTEVTTILNKDTTVYIINELSETRFIATSRKPMDYNGKSYIVKPTFTPKQ